MLVNYEKYYKYYLQGKLDNKLGRYYNDTKIEAAKEKGLLWEKIRILKNN